MTRMLSPLVALVAILAGAEATNLRAPKGLAVTEKETASLTKSDIQNDFHRHLADEDDDPATPDEALLMSEQCTDFLELLEKQFEKFFSFSDHTVSSFLCNPIERGEIKSTAKKMEAAVSLAKNDDRFLKEEEGGVNPCALAWSRSLLKGNTDKFKKAMKTSSSCKKEVSQELANMKEEKRRVLSFLGEDGGDNRSELVRRLWLRQIVRTAAKVATVGAVVTGVAVTAVACAAAGSPVGVFTGATCGSMLVAIVSSDQRLKHNIQFVGTSNDMGIPIYTFQYLPGIDARDAKLNDHSTYSGVLAQDLLADHPDAVKMTPDGYYAVDYSVIDVDFKKIMN